MAVLVMGGGEYHDWLNGGRRKPRGLGPMGGDVWLCMFLCGGGVFNVKLV